MGMIKRMFTGPDKVKFDQGALNNAYSNIKSYDEQKATIGNAQANVANRPATQINMDPQAQFRDQQVAFGDTLLNRANGAAPSAAEMQMQRAGDRNLANTVALAASGGGGGFGGNARTLGRTLMEANRGANLDAGMLRATEQANAENTYANFIQGARTQDIGLATSQAQLSAQEQAQADQLTAQYVQMGLSVEQSRLKALQDMEALKLGIAQANADRTAQSDGALLGGAASLGASLLGMGDKK